QAAGRGEAVLQPLDAGAERRASRRGRPGGFGGQAGGQGAGAAGGAPGGSPFSRGLRGKGSDITRARRTDGPAGQGPVAPQRATQALQPSCQTGRCISPRREASAYQDREVVIRPRCLILAVQVTWGVYGLSGFSLSLGVGSFVRASRSFTSAHNRA